MEVPIIGSYSLEWTEKWIEAAVPSSSPSPTAAAPADCVPRVARDCASSITVGDPPTHLIWKIHKNRPHHLELLELCRSKEFPKFGLRIAFPHALSASVHLCPNEIEKGTSSSLPYLLYALTVSGVAYLLRLGPISTYASCSAFLRDELVEFNMSGYGPITCAAATPSGCLVVGRQNGSLAYCQLGTHDPTAPGFVVELRNDLFLRFKDFISSGTMVIGAVQDLGISIVHGRPLVFVLHSDAMFRVWDLSCHAWHDFDNMQFRTIRGAKIVRLWVGQFDGGSNLIHYAFLCRKSSEIISNTIYAFILHVRIGVKLNLGTLRSKCIIPLDEAEAGCVESVDVKFISDRICILTNNRLVLQNHNPVTTVNTKDAISYALQEDFVADQLFQSSKYSSDELILETHSVFSSSKDHSRPDVSSIFLQMLFLPGVHHNMALRSTLLDYNKHWTDSDFQSLTADMLKKEIISLIEHDSVNDNPMSIFCKWKSFCSRYFQNWCKSNSPCGLLVDFSTGTFGLIRKNSVSLFRCLEDIKRLIDVTSDDLGNKSDLFDGDLEFEVLAEMLKFVVNVNQ